MQRISDCAVRTAPLHPVVSRRADNQRLEHQANGQARAACRADTAAELAIECTGKVNARHTRGRLDPMGQLRRNRRFNRSPWQLLGQHDQWMPQIDHLVQARAKKTGVLIVKSPENRAAAISFSGNQGSKNHAAK